MNTAMVETAIEMPVEGPTSPAVATAWIVDSTQYGMEHALVAATLQGNLDAFNELVIEYQNLAYALAVRLLPSREEAADAVQESFLKAFRGLSTFKNGSFQSWFARIVINTCYDTLRAKRRIRWEVIADEPSYDQPGEEGASRPYPLRDEGESPHAYVERMELSARIELGLRALPQDQRLVLLLSDIHGYPYDEISEITGMPIGTVKSRLSRARLKLRDFLLEAPELLGRYKEPTLQHRRAKMDSPSAF